MEKTAGRYLTVIALLIVSGVLATAIRFVRVSADEPSNFAAIPLQQGQWSGQEFALSDMTLEVLRATNTTSRSYSNPQKNTASLFIGYFEDQKYGAQIHSPKHCLPGGGWGIIESSPTILNIGGSEFTVNRVVIGNKNLRQVVYYWFRTRSGTLTNEYQLKLDLVWNSIRLQPTDAALIRLVANVDDTNESVADEVLKDFLSDFYESIENSLPFESSGV